MEVFTVVEHQRNTSTQVNSMNPSSFPADPDGEEEQGGEVRREEEEEGSTSSSSCRVKVPFGLAVTIQTIIGLGLTGLLAWNLADLDAARNGLPIFGRLTVMICLVISFHLQKNIFCGDSHDEEISSSHLIFNLIVYVTTLLSGITFWLIQMQYSSNLSLSVANYSSVEPIILITGTIIGIYCLRRGMSFYESAASRDVQLDIYTRPLFPQILIIVSVLESIFGLIFGILMNLVIESSSTTGDWEFTKRCVCLVGIYVSAVVNELAIMFSRDNRYALLFKTGGFFTLLLCTQITWWLSYYRERQLTLYGLGVGFLTLLFGVLYTVEMSLQTAQLNAHNPDHPMRQPQQNQGPPSFLRKRRQSGDSKKGNNEEEDVEEEGESSITTTANVATTTAAKILNQQCVIGFSITLQLGLGLLPVVVLIMQDNGSSAKTDQEDNKNRIANWFMWAVGFFASLILNEVILFQKSVMHWLVSLCNSAFCVNFLAGCVLSYRGIRVSMEEHGIPLSFWMVLAMWVPYFFLSHIDFVRLVKFSLKLEKKQKKLSMKKKKKAILDTNMNVSLSFASGIQGMVAIAAWLPTMDFAYFPGKIFSILTFPSLAFIAEVIFRLGQSCKGPFLMTFTAFSLGAGHSQLVWYMSVLFSGGRGRGGGGGDEPEFLGMGRKWLLLLGVGMGLLSLIYVARFLYVIISKWERKEQKLI